MFSAVQEMVYLPFHDGQRFVEHFAALIPAGHPFPGPDDQVLANIVASLVARQLPHSNLDPDLGETQRALPIAVLREMCEREQGYHLPFASVPVRPRDVVVKRTERGRDNVVQVANCHCTGSLARVRAYAALLSRFTFAHLAR